MTCRELLRLLDGDGSVDQAPATEHISACASCRRALERWRAMKSALTSMNDDPLPPFLHARVMAGIKAERKEPSAWSWAPIARWLAPLAVVGIVAVVVGHGVWRTPEPLVRKPAPAPAAPDRKTTPAHREKRTAEARKGLAKTGVEVESKDMEKETADEPARESDQLSVNGAQPTHDGEIGSLSFAPEVPSGRSVIKEGTQLQSEARERKKRRLEESALHEESERFIAPKDAEEELRSLDYASVSEDKAATAAPQAAAAPMLAPRGKAKARTHAIACLLSPVEGSESPRSIEIPFAAAPPTGAVWLIAVLPDGRVRIADARTSQAAGSRARSMSESDMAKTEGQAATPPAQSFSDRFVESKDLSSIESVRELPPGRYLLRRAP